MRINTSIIKSLRPCQDRFENWEKHYNNFKGDILEFLSLKKITASDKIWVAVRVLPCEIVKIFAIDCAFSAYSYSDGAIAADTAIAAAVAIAAPESDSLAKAATYAACNAAACAAYDGGAAHVIERERQVDALIYLIETA